MSIVKFPAHGVKFSGKEFFNYIVPLDPSVKAGLAGALPVTQKSSTERMRFFESMITEPCPGKSDDGARCMSF